MVQQPEGLWIHHRREQETIYLLHKIDQIIFAIPTATKDERREILNICNETDCVVKTVPGIYQIVDGDVKLSKLRPISMEDLLGREPIKTDLASVTGYIEGKLALRTGPSFSRLE